MLHQEALRLTRFATHGITLQHTVPRLIILVHVHANDSGAKKEEHVCSNRGTSNKLCNTLQHVSSSEHLIANCSTLQPLQRTATQCNTLQHTAAYHDLLYNTGSVLQCCHAVGVTHKVLPCVTHLTGHTKRSCVTVCNTLQQVSPTRKHLMGHTPLHTT